MRRPDFDRSGGGWWPTALMVAILAGFGVAQAAVLGPNGDASWYVYMAGRVLDGARPYIDLVDTNPPLIVWLDMAVVAAARGVGLAPLTAFQAAVFGLVGVMLAMAWRLGRGQPEALRRAGIVAWAFLLLVHVGAAFGQREHLLMILILPYAQGAVAEARGERIARGWALATGLLGGVGFALKPQFLVPVALVEGFLGWRCGRGVWRRPQAMALLGVFAAYGVAVAWWTPGYFRLAVRFAALYPHHRPTGAVLASSSWRLALVVPALAVSWAVGRRRATGWAEVFGLLTVGLTAVVYLTGKGWLYHWFPAEATSLALLAGSGRSWSPTVRADGGGPGPSGSRLGARAGVGTLDRGLVLPAASRPGGRPAGAGVCGAGRGGAGPVLLGPHFLPAHQRGGGDLGHEAPDALAGRGLLRPGDVGTRSLPCARGEVGRGAAVCRRGRRRLRAVAADLAAGPRRPAHARAGGF